MLVATAVKLLVAAGLAGGAAGPVKVTVTAAGHTPKVGTRWTYSVHVTKGGRPVAAKLTEQVIDPLGGATAVEYGTTSRKIANWPFRGTFRDFVVWPGESRGIPLTLRITVEVGGAKRVVSYHVTPRG